VVDKKKFRWMSFPGILLLMVGCAIITGDDDDDEVEQPQMLQYLVTAEVLNIREAPSIKSSIIAKAVRGTLVVPSHQAGGWYRITINDGSTGWAYGDFLAPVR
jgi:uncharacterized protein YgiM (DUF1202 family)